MECCAPMELLWASTGEVLKASEGAQPLCALTEHRKNTLFEKENSKDLPDV